MNHTRRIAALSVLAILAVTTAAPPATALFRRQEVPAAAAGAPIPQNQDIETYQAVPYQGKLTAVDNEGDPILFSIADQPSKGAVALQDDGITFIYTPDAKKSGKDSFTFTASDTGGNTSAPATISIDIRKQKTGVTYRDMAHSAAHAAAIRLAEEGLFVGEQLAGSYFFHPDETMSRSQFLAIAMETAGVRVSEQIRLTGFQDDSAIAAWAKGYASAAVGVGIISGVSTPQGICFRGDDAITLQEAAAVMDRLLDMADVEVTAPFSGQTAWAAQAAANMSSIQVIPSGIFTSQAADAPITRAEAAQILAAGLRVMEQTSSEKGLLRWIK